MPSLVAAAVAMVASLAILTNEADVIAATGIATTVAMAAQLLMPFSERRSQHVEVATDWFASLEGLAECLVLMKKFLPRQSKMLERRRQSQEWANIL